MYGNLNFTSAFIFLGVVCGFIGWGGVIELFIWLFSFVHVTIGG